MTSQTPPTADPSAAPSIAAQEPAPRSLPPLLRLVLELGPPLTFFFAFQAFNEEGQTLYAILVATGLLMAAAIVSNIVTYLMTGALSRLTLVTTAVVLLMGALTLYLSDETFIKMRPTIANTLLGSVLLIGILRGQSYLKFLLDDLMPMDDEGWRKITRNWCIYFFAIACLNEGVWRTVDTETWVTIKTFVYLPLALIFAVSQTPLMTRHALDPKT